jgi:hypothetical protein
MEPTKTVRGTVVQVTLDLDLNFAIEQLQSEEKLANNGKLIRTKADQIVRMAKFGIIAYKRTKDQ